MPLCLCLFLVLALTAASAARAQPAAAEPMPGDRPGHSRLVAVTAEGQLASTPYSSRGDTLPDFSMCGYGGGGVPLPEPPVRVTVAPQSDGDDTARVQAALDAVAALPADATGLRGAVLLRRGTYRIGTTLQLRTSGVVLRGEGDAVDGTVLLATTTKPEPLIAISGAAGPADLPDTSREIVADYVPVGARVFTVDDARGLAPGQTVFVVRRGNTAWISALAMDRITGRPTNPGSTRQWTPFDLRFDRVITAVAGRQVTIDAPITCAIDARWGGGALVVTADAGRIAHCGVEHLRAISRFDPSQTAEHAGQRVLVDEAHATYVVAFRAVKHAWLRRVTAQHFAHGPADIGSDAKWITVEDCAALAPVSIITGGRRYPYRVNGQLALVQRCTAEEARHAFLFGARVCGPNVFLDCRSTRDHATSEPHERWSVGGLYDNVDTSLAIQDRQWMGSGHGWSGANYVVWNSRGTLICQQPPTAQNFAIGFVGQRGRDAFPRPAGWWESEGTPVTPRSLYQSQLAARLGQVSE